MKMLQMNPLKHEIELWADEGALDDVTTVYFRFGEAKGNIPLVTDEVKRIGEWFTTLAKEMAKRK